MKHLLVWLSNNWLIKRLTCWNLTFYATPALWDLKFEFDRTSQDDDTLVVCLGPLQFEYNAWKLDGTYEDGSDHGITWSHKDWDKRWHIVEDGDESAPKT